MRPLIAALRSRRNPALVGLGLQFLEMCVDSLTPAFFHSLISQVDEQLLTALWTHCFPAPYVHGEQAYRLMGKLAGYNRRIFAPGLRALPPSAVQPDGHFDVVLQFANGADAAVSAALPLERVLHFAVSLLTGAGLWAPPSPAALEHAQSLLHSVVVSLLGAPRVEDAEAACAESASALLQRSVKAQRSLTPSFDFFGDQNP